MSHQYIFDGRLKKQKENLRFPKIVQLVGKLRERFKFGIGICNASKMKNKRLIAFFLIPKLSIVKDYSSIMIIWVIKILLVVRLYPSLVGESPVK